MKSITQLEMLRQTLLETDEFDDEKTAGRKSDRKKRRGVIEKRRRDRINTSLTELKRLVPSAYEKQGSTKLEKAEILQLTVDHLQLLNAKGLNGYNGNDPSSLALDYRSMGFRECVAEVARYLATVEGMELQDPLRMRMLGHLEAYSAQRDVTAKANLQSFNTWSSWSRLHNNGSRSSALTSNHTKYHHSYHSGLTCKTGLGLFSTNTSSSSDVLETNPYFAARRLNTAISSLGHHYPMVSSNLGHITQSMSSLPVQHKQQQQQPQTVNCHIPSINSSFTSHSPTNANTSNTGAFNVIGHPASVTNSAVSMKLMREIGSDLAY